MLKITPPEQQARRYDARKEWLATLTMDLKGDTVLHGTRMSG